MQTVRSSLDIALADSLDVQSDAGILCPQLLAARLRSGSSFLMRRFDHEVLPNLSPAYLGLHVEAAQNSVDDVCQITVYS